MQDTYTKNMTIDEIQENDLEMTRDAIKNANKYHFGSNKIAALHFIKKAMDNTLRFLGVVVSVPNSPAARLRYEKGLDKMLNDKQIRIENRTQYRGQDAWRCGLYIYQRDELVAFVSTVLTERRDSVNPITMKIVKSDIGYMVITNARMDEGKRIWTPALVKGGGDL